MPERRLLPEGERPQPACPKCGTPMVGGNAPGATYWVCPVDRRDLIVGFEYLYPLKGEE